MLKAVLPIMLFVFAFPPFSFASPVNRASYWVGRLKSPDEIILGASGIEELNDIIISRNGQMADLDRLPKTVFGGPLTEWLLHDPMPSTDAKRYDARGRRLKGAFFDAIFENMDLGGVDGVNEVRPCVVIDRADVRAFPTDEPVLVSPAKKGFDAFQYSSVYPTERAALLHVSRDGRWGFFQTSTVRGWIRLDKVALVDDAMENENSGPWAPLVVTGSKVKVYGDGRFKTLLGTVPMGAVLDMREAGGADGPYIVRFPKAGTDGSVIWADGYVKKGADVNEGFLPYTKRNVIEQAFKMLGEEYGWGGKDGKRDCSVFIKDLFASMGIRLPRNSRDQRSIGEVLADWDYPEGDIQDALSNAEPGITLLGLKGHIMLYIGERDNRPYVIHQVYGYVEKSRLKVINRVAVTDLDLGRRSKAGPLKKRIRSVNEVLVPSAPDGRPGYEGAPPDPSSGI
ncbi:MAG: SH3 domain-containing protein [Deltaproteobacteria bacterium]|nr:SH3 domain-containing protein [Deltaproteobacteria bacterium]